MVVREGDHKVNMSCQYLDFCQANYESRCPLDMATF